MDQNNHNSDEPVPHDSETFGTVPKGSESFGNVPNDSESFRTMRNDSERFRSVPNLSERRESHTLTVREAARLFESAGVARTERSIVNWCQPDKLGMPRLENYFDQNERKYYLTPESVERVIREEIQKATKVNGNSERAGNNRKASETQNSAPDDSKATPWQLKEMEREMNDLKIANRVKDAFIEQLRQEREGLVNHLIQSSQKVGELQTRLLQLEEPKP
jgi:hypothetical protein